jgi:HEAT repeat protein
MKTAFFLSATLLFSNISLAAIPKSIEIEAALRLPVSKRVEAIEKQGLRGLHELQKMAFDKSQSLETRWRAITSIGRVHPKSGRAVLEKAMVSPEWFVRNAALVVAPYSERAWAVKWARILIHDQALVVRTAAVQSLRQLNAVDSQALLWEKLYSSENYRAGKSLWIRRHILEALAQFARVGQEKNFITVLADKDASLHPIAMRTLEKITRQKYENPMQWQAWWSNRKNI